MGRGGGRSVLLLGVLGLGLVMSGCGGSSNGDVTLRVASGKSTEERVLAEIYAQALEAAGYKVEAKLGLEPVLARENLEEGRIAGYPGHLDTVLTEIAGVQLEDVPADPELAYVAAKKGLEEEGLTAFPPAPFSLSNAIGMLRPDAQARHLKAVSDLRGKSEAMMLKGGRECHLRVDCLAGLEHNYDVYFEGFSEADPEDRYKVLEQDEADASVLFTTDGQLAGSKSRFVILAEDQGTFPAGNAIWLTTPQIVARAGPDYRHAILEAQKGLTLAVMQGLDARVELKGEPLTKVAGDYLRSIRKPKSVEGSA